MGRWKNPSYTIYTCTNHVVWIPKYRHVRDSIRKRCLLKKLSFVAGTSALITFI